MNIYTLLNIVLVGKQMNVIKRLNVLNPTIKEYNFICFNGVLGLKIFFDVSTVAF